MGRITSFLLTFLLSGCFISPSQLITSTDKGDSSADSNFVSSKVLVTGLSKDSEPLAKIYSHEASTKVLYIAGKTVILSDPLGLDIVHIMNLEDYAHKFFSYFSESGDKILLLDGHRAYIYDVASKDLRRLNTAYDSKTYTISTTVVAYSKSLNSIVLLDNYHNQYLNNLVAINTTDSTMDLLTTTSYSNSNYKMSDDGSYFVFTPSSPRVDSYHFPTKSATTLFTGQAYRLNILGSRVYFQNTAGDDFLYSNALSGGSLSTLTPTVAGSDINSLVVSPDKSKIAMKAKFSNFYYELVVVNADGTSYSTPISGLSDANTLSGFGFTEDNKIYWYGTLDSTTKYSMYVSDLDSSNSFSSPVQLFTNRTYSVVFQQDLKNYFLLKESTTNNYLSVKKDGSKLTTIPGDTSFTYQSFQFKDYESDKIYSLVGLSGSLIVEIQSYDLNSDTAAKVVSATEQNYMEINTNANNMTVVKVGDRFIYSNERGLGSILKSIKSDATGKKIISEMNLRYKKLILSKNSEQVSFIHLNSNGTQVLYNVKNSGAISKIGDSIGTGEVVTSATYDPQLNQIYYTIYTDDYSGNYQNKYYSWDFINAPALFHQNNFANSYHKSFTSLKYSENNLFFSDSSGKYYSFNKNDQSLSTVASTLFNQYYAPVDIDEESGKIFFVDEQSSAEQLYSANLDGTGQTVAHPSFVGNGDMIWYELDKVNKKIIYWGEQDTNNQVELYISNYDGSSGVKLSSRVTNSATEANSYAKPLFFETNNIPSIQYEYSKSYSSDLQKVYYVADQNTADKYELFSVNYDGSNNTKISPNLIADGDVNYYLLLDNQIMFIANAETVNENNLYFCNLDGSDLIKVGTLSSNISSYYTNFKLSKDKKYLALQYSTPNAGLSLVYIDLETRSILLKKVSSDLSQSYSNFSINNNLLIFLLEDGSKTINIAYDPISNKEKLILDEATDLLKKSPLTISDVDNKAYFFMQNESSPDTFDLIYLIFDLTKF